ncbi:Tub family [Musa troglodytarum]|uniref:Tubby-like F-box protein n=1 Tax=Musa troglodytarum TaxID=320322 RepID=A0A9E7HIC1_9LILI|nr:Tub family [Musa troglodytarum]
MLVVLPSSPPALHLVALDYGPMWALHNVSKTSRVRTGRQCAYALTFPPFPLHNTPPSLCARACYRVREREREREREEAAIRKGSGGVLGGTIPFLGPNRRFGHIILRDSARETFRGSWIHKIFGKDSFGSLSRRSFEVRLSGLLGHHKGKSYSSVDEPHDFSQITQQSHWATLPPELLRDVVKRLEENESTWPSRRHVVACAAVCRAWREMCKEIVRSPEFCGKLTFPISLKQPGPRDGMIQCFIKRDKSKLTYHLYLCLSPAVLGENGKFLLSAKRNPRTTCTEYVISTDAGNISRSSSTYVGKLRSNFIGTKFRIYDTQPPYDGLLCVLWTNKPQVLLQESLSQGPVGQLPHSSGNIRTECPRHTRTRRMHCIMHSIPSALEPGGIVPGQPDNLIARSLEDSFRSMSSLSSFMDRSLDFSSSRFSATSGRAQEGLDATTDTTKERPLVLRNKPPRWHEQLQCWCLNFRGRVTIASVKNFQLIAAATQPAAVGPTTAQPSGSGHDKIILQFGKVAKDTFTMDYRYPLSAFQAFAICLSSFDTKLACE